jgi:hypothetical protein
MRLHAHEDVDHGVISRLRTSAHGVSTVIDTEMRGRNNVASSLLFAGRARSSDHWP